MAQKQVEKEDFGCKPPCQGSVLECHTGRTGAGSGCDTGEGGAGSPSPVLLPGSIHEGTPQDAGGALHQPVGFQAG